MAKVVPLSSDLPLRVYERYSFPPSAEDTAILKSRLRLTADNFDLDLQTREALIPTAMGMEFGRVEAIFRSDLELCIAWLEDGKPTLEELLLITSILDKWSANHSRTNPYWRDDPTPEEMEINRKLCAVVQRMIARGQYKEDEE
jgi:hypothetical protein